MANLTINGLAELAAPDDADFVGIWDVSAGQFLKVKRSVLTGVVSGGFALTVPATGTAVINGGTANFGIGTNAGSTIEISTAKETAGDLATGGVWVRNANVAWDANTSFSLLTMRDASSVNLASIRCVKAAEGAVWGLAFDGYSAGVAANKLVIQGNGDVTVTALAGVGNRAVYSDANGVLTNSSSDARLKTDVTLIDAVEALAVVDSLRPVRYNWIDTDKRGAQREMGLIAQDVAEIVPEVVGENSDGMLSLDYARLVTVLIGAVQELSARVKELESNL